MMETFEIYDFFFHPPSRNEWQEVLRILIDGNWLSYPELVLHCAGSDSAGLCYIRWRATYDLVHKQLATLAIVRGAINTLSERVSYGC